MKEILEQLTQQFAAFGPNLLAGLAVLVLGWLVAVVASYVVRKLLGKLTLDNKIAQWVAGPNSKANLPVEMWVGKAVFYVLLLLAVIAFLQTIKLTVVTDPLNQLVEPVMAYLPRLVGAGLLIMVLGLMLARFVASLIASNKSRNAGRLALFARVVILALAGTMALRQTGLANEIVNLAFGLTLGALAVAAALAFGLGGREMASRLLLEWRQEKPSKKTVK